MVLELVNTILKKDSQMKYRENPIKSKNLLWATIGISVVTLGIIQLSRSHNKKVDIEDNNNDEDQIGRTHDTPIEQSSTNIITEKPINTLASEFRKNIQKKTGSKILVIGDSQVLRTMGKAFQEALIEYKDNIDYWGIEGTTPNKILKNHVLKSTNDGNLLISKLSQKPDIIVIQLGDNGINSSAECDRLIRYINSFYPEQALPLILWSGPFPLCIPDTQNSRTRQYVLPACKDDARCINNYQAKKKNVWTLNVKNAMKVFPNVYFNSPYDSNPFNIPNIKCFTADGVHINKDPMRQYVDFLLNKELTNE